MALKKSTDWLNWAIGFFTFYLAIITVSVIWWQGWRLKRQLELQVITELYKEWNSEKMMEWRSDLCSILSSDGAITDNSDDGLDRVEGVIEFLERIASYHMNGVLSIGLVWDTFSFYIMRYYFYTNNAIGKIEKRWTNDDTLYYDLAKLYIKLMKVESRRRWLTRERIEEGFKKEIKIFKKAEGYEKTPTTKLLIELKPSLIDMTGVGVFAVVDIKKGEKVADGIPKEDFSEVIPWGEFSHFGEEVQKKIMSFCVGTPEGFVPPENLDFNKLSIEWYFNHSCNGNLGFNEKGDFIAIRNIRKGEELSYDYGLVESNPSFKMPCECKDKNCRNIITGNDWKLLMKDELKNQYIHPFLRLD